MGIKGISREYSDELSIDMKWAAQAGVDVLKRVRIGNKHSVKRVRQRASLREKVWFAGIADDIQ